MSAADGIADVACISAIECIEDVACIPAIECIACIEPLVTFGDADDA
jgi:hypothetical protein